jgi:hypothetical protein
MGLGVGCAREGKFKLIFVKHKKIHRLLRP